MNKRYISGCLVLLMLFCDLGLMVRPAAAEDAKVNVALNKAVTVSTEYLEHWSKKEHLVDGKSDTHWAAKAGVTTEQPQWVMIDLGEDYNLSGAEITWRENTVVKYMVETSADQQAWTNVADQSENADAKQIADLTFEQNDVRYIRLNISFFKGEGVWPEILEFKVWGESEGTEPANITKYDSIEVKTVTRSAPVLPNQVKAWYQNGKSGMVPVEWDSIDPSEYAHAGSFTVTGSVYGALSRASA